jgi:hypothetical protein
LKLSKELSRPVWVSALFILSACAGRLNNPVELSVSTETPPSQVIQVAAEFIAQPQVSTLLTGASVTVSGSSGTPPYQYFIQSGGGSIHPSTGVYTAGAGSEVVIVEVKDAASRVAYSTIQVIQPPQIRPQSLTLAEGSVFPFSVSGTQSPFSYQVVSGPGSVNASGRFTAGALSGVSPETAILRVTDQAGNSSHATITINPALLLSPSAVNLAKNSAQTFSATHGVPPYTFSMISGNGVIHPTTGVYAAPSQIGVDIIKVRDALGNEASAAIAIQNDLVLSPLNSVVAQGSSITLTPVGGVAPYSFTFAASPLGSIGASSGIYSAPGSEPGQYNGPSHR